MVTKIWRPRPSFSATAPKRAFLAVREEILVLALARQVVQGELVLAEHALVGHRVDRAPGGVTRCVRTTLVITDPLISSCRKCGLHEALDLVGSVR